MKGKKQKKINIEKKDTVTVEKSIPFMYICTAPRAGNGTP